MYSFDTNEKPIKRRDNKKTKKNSGGLKPKNPRYERKDKYDPDLYDLLYEEGELEEDE